MARPASRLVALGLILLLLGMQGLLVAHEHQDTCGPCDAHHPGEEPGHDDDSDECPICDAACVTADPSRPAIALPHPEPVADRALEPAMAPRPDPVRDLPSIRAPPSV
jgi:hypothetical protein